MIVLLLPITAFCVWLGLSVVGSNLSTPVDAIILAFLFSGWCMCVLAALLEWVDA